MNDNETQENEYRSRDNGSSANDGSYRYVRPESDEMLYRDASVEPAEDELRMPRHYTPPQKENRHNPQPPKPKKQKKAAGEHTKAHFWVGAICISLVCAMLGGIAGSSLTMYYMRDRLAALEAPPTTDNSLNTHVPENGLEVAPTPRPVRTKAPSEIYANACNQVVGITTEVTYRNYFGIAVSQPVSGTGFFISDDGHVLTNYHVIEYAVKYRNLPKVVLHDGTAYDAKIIGGDPDNDIAVLQVDVQGISPVTIGNSDGIQVGDCIYAVGNPLGELEFSMTTGSVSARDRLISTTESSPAINMFQIDAAVNQGNSGGPVYDVSGEVVGIVTAKYLDEGIEGLGFAIPINDAMEIANDLITNGYVTGKAKLGVDVQTMSASAARYYKTVEGAYLRYIEPGSSAEVAGLQLGDVIYRFGDLDIYDRESLKSAVRSYHAGDTVELSVYRDGQHLTIMVTLGEDTSDGATKDPTTAPIAYYGHFGLF